MGSEEDRCEDCSALAELLAGRCVACAGWALTDKPLPMGAHVRVLACDACATPLVTPARGGEVTCPGCGGKSTIAPLSLDPGQTRAEGGALPTARFTEQLRARQIRYQPTATVDTRALASLETHDRQAPYQVTQAFLGAARPLREASRRRAAAGAYRGSAQQAPQLEEEEQRLYWIAHCAARLFAARAEPSRARPLVETAYELLADAGWRQLALAELSHLAEMAGDLDAARRWLEPCERRPPWLGLHSALSLQRARIAARADSWDDVLAAVGESHAEVVAVAPAQQIAIGLLRVAALQAVGQADAADRELEVLVDIHLVVDLRAALESEPLLAHAKAPWELLEARWQAEAQRKRRRAMRVGLLLAAIGVVLLLAGGLVFRYGGTMNTLLCEASGGTRSCRVIEKLLGSPVGERTVEGLSGARVETVSGEQPRSLLLLLTNRGELELSSCSRCADEMAALAAKIERFVAGETLALTLVEPVENPMPYFGFALAVVAVAVMALGFGRMGKALLQRSKIA